MNALKISVLVPGRLHGFDMAHYFQELGILNELVTGYPKKYVTPFGINGDLIKSIYLNEIINRTTNFLGLGYPLDFWACEVFDFLASQTIKYDSDIYFIWSSYGLKTIKKIRKKNPKAKIILVRGSAHIAEQEEQLKKINNTTKHQINPKIIAKEIKEYEVCDFITVPSTYAYNSFIDREFKASQIFLNLLGVDLEEFPYKEKEIIPGYPIVIGNIGTLSKQKNIEALINVIAKLNQEFSDFKLILAGPVDQISFDQNLLFKHDFIDYKGKLPQNELYKVYHQIDVFVLNSVQDGFGMVILQAMSSGCPIITTTNTGGPDVVEEYQNGILIPIMDDDSLKKALIWFYEHKNKIPKMGKESRKISETGFTWKAFGDRNIKFINQILKH